MSESDWRRRHYIVCILVPWLTAGIVAMIGLLANRSPATIGLTLHDLTPNASKQIVLFIVVGFVVVFLMTVAIHFVGPKVVKQIRHKMPRFVQALPHTTHERLIFLLVALTAGICEEILFRGFGIAYIKWLWSGANRISIIVIVGIAFGLAHYRQGRPTVAFAGIAGGVFGWMTLATGTLLPAIVVHCLVDIRASFFPAELTEPVHPRVFNQGESTLLLHQSEPSAEPGTVISTSPETSPAGIVRYVPKPGKPLNSDPTDS